MEIRTHTDVRFHGPGANSKVGAKKFPLEAPKKEVVFIIIIIFCQDKDFASSPECVRLFAR
jgi:hypothetical protein